MIVSLIVAMDETRAIGIDNELPWHLSQDLKHFKRITMGHHLIMGRKTYQSIGGILPGRTMIILTRNKGFQAEGCLIAHSFQEALHLAEERGEEEVFVIGGASVFEQALPISDRLYLTRVHTEVEADTYFPAFQREDWELVSETRYEADPDNQYPFTIKYFVRAGGELDDSA